MLPIVCRTIVFFVRRYKKKIEGVKNMNLIHIFAKNLKKYRIKNGMSQEYLAELAGLHRTYISLLEREKKNISLNNIQKIAEALKIKPEKLLSNEPETEFKD